MSTPWSSWVPQLPFMMPPPYVCQPLPASTAMDTGFFLIA